MNTARQVVSQSSALNPKPYKPSRNNNLFWSTSVLSCSLSLARGLQACGQSVSDTVGFGDILDVVCQKPWTPRHSPRSHFQYSYGWICINIEQTSALTEFLKSNELPGANHIYMYMCTWAHPYKSYVTSHVYCASRLCLVVPWWGACMPTFLTIVTA